jgi:hypothetical protein
MITQLIKIDHKDLLTGDIASEYLQTLLDRLKTYPDTAFADKEYEKRICDTLNLINLDGEKQHALKRNSSEDKGRTGLENY